MIYVLVLIYYYNQIRNLIHYCHKKKIKKEVAMCSCNDIECKVNILMGCPVFRMGLIKQHKTFYHYIGDNTVDKFVIHPKSCIGCRICINKCKHNKAKMYDW